MACAEAMSSRSSPWMRSDFAVLPLLLAMNVALLAAPAAISGGLEQITRGAAPHALVLLTAAMAAEVLAQPGDRVLTLRAGHEHRLATSLNVVQGAALLVSLQLIFAVAATSASHAWWNRAGMVIAAGACVLRFTAIRTLDRGFTDGFAPTCTHVVTRGPYRFCGHPAEAGILLLPIGLAMMLDACAVLPLAVPVLAACSVIRIAAEQRALAGEPLSARTRMEQDLH